MVYFTKQVATTKGEKLYCIIATYIDISKCVYVGPLHFIAFRMVQCNLFNGHTKFIMGGHCGHPYVKRYFEPCSIYI